METANHLTAALQLLEAQRPNELENFLDQLHPVELAGVLSEVDLETQPELFKAITGLDQLSAVIAHSDDRLRDLALELLDDTRVAAVVRRMEIDDAADLLRNMPRRRQVSVLRRCSAARVKELTALLAYDQETAGGIMTTRFVRISTSSTTEEALALLRTGLSQNATDEDTDISYLYVLDTSGRLEGTLSLRKVLASGQNTPVSELMTRSPITVTPDDDQEHVARLIESYDLKSIAVVSPEDGLMLGIVTVDDVIDVIEEEHTEDILRLAGTEDIDTVGADVQTALRSRMPWLMASWLGGVGGALLLGNYSSTLEKVVALAFFMPVVFGMGGNVGSQSSTITVRGIATGELGRYQVLPRLRKEILVGATLGITFGLLLGLVAFFLYSDPRLSIIVGTSILATMTCASSIGSMLPVFFQRLGIDPAVASGPLVTTTTDLLSITIYFSVASIFL